MANINDNYTFSADTGVISRLDDNPNESDLDAAGLKAAFDAGATNVVTQINSDLIPAINNRCDEVASAASTGVETVSTNLGSLSGLNTTNKTSAVNAINEVNTNLGTKTADTGWVNLTVNTSVNNGTWQYLKYRKIGNKVKVIGRCDSYPFSAPTSGGGEPVSKVLTTLPEGCRPTVQHYWLAAVQGGRLARYVVNTGGTVVIDYGIQISNGSYLNTGYWTEFSFEFYID